MRRTKQSRDAVARADETTLNNHFDCLGLLLCSTTANERTYETKREAISKKWFPCCQNKKKEAKINLVCRRVACSRECFLSLSTRKSASWKNNGNNEKDRGEKSRNSHNKTQQGRSHSDTEKILKQSNERTRLWKNETTLSRNQKFVSSLQDLLTLHVNSPPLKSVIAKEKLGDCPPYLHLSISCRADC